MKVNLAVMRRPDAELLADAISRQVCTAEDQGGSAADDEVFILSNVQAGGEINASLVQRLVRRRKVMVHCLAAARQQKEDCAGENRTAEYCCDERHAGDDENHEQLSQAGMDGNKAASIPPPIAPDFSGLFHLAIDAFEPQLTKLLPAHLVPSRGSTRITQIATEHGSRPRFARRVDARVTKRKQHRRPSAVFCDSHVNSAPAAGRRRDPRKISAVIRVIRVDPWLVPWLRSLPRRATHIRALSSQVEQHLEGMTRVGERGLVFMEGGDAGNERPDPDGTGSEQVDRAPERSAA